jgi:hypothetical protein
MWPSPIAAIGVDGGHDLKSGFAEIFWAREIQFLNPTITIGSLR